ncbi:MAG: hypothetical protein WCC41_10500 [Rhodomicrobium sp.]
MREHKGEAHATFRFRDGGSVTATFTIKVSSFGCDLVLFEPHAKDLALSSKAFMAIRSLPTGNTVSAVAAPHAGKADGLAEH